MEQGDGGRNRAQVAERLMAADCKSAAPCELRRFESSPVHQKLECVGSGGMQQGSSSGLSLAEVGRRSGAVLAGLAVLAWQTMEPGKFRTLVFVVLGGLALRVLLGSRRRGTTDTSSAVGARISDADVCTRRADVAQLVEHSLGKGEVTGSIPVISSRVWQSWRLRAGVTQW